MRYTASASSRTSTPKRTQEKEALLVKSGDLAPREGMYRLCAPEAQEVVYLDEEWVVPEHENEPCQWVFYCSTTPSED